MHCSGFFSCGALRKTLPALLRAARSLGATTSLDTNNDASGQWGAMDGLWHEVLPAVSLFMPNELEACAIASVAADDLGGAIARLVRQVGGRLVVTRGADGALVMCEKPSDDDGEIDDGGGGGTRVAVRAPKVAAIDPVVTTLGLDPEVAL